MVSLFSFTFLPFVRAEGAPFLPERRGMVLAAAISEAAVPGTMERSGGHRAIDSSLWV
ncbi:hypothetical protein HOF92_16960 [bacterium]|jgi:hypothetical protein|nr:hypothetical protein [bacterium]